MRETADGLPQIGPTARTLGVRPEEACEQALRSAEPVGTLRSLAEQMITHGKREASVLEFFEAVRARLQAENRAADEDAVLDAMDFVTGWCGPHMRIQRMAGDPHRSEEDAAPVPSGAAPRRQSG